MAVEMKLMKIVILAFILTVLFWIGEGYSQNGESRRDMFVNRQIKFSLAPVLYDNLNLTYNGEKLLNSRPCFSAEATISYYEYLAKGFGINIGAGLGLAPINTNFYFKSSPNTIFNPDIYFDLNDYIYADYMWIFPFSVQKMFSTKKEKLFYNIEAGIKWNRIIAYPYEITNQVDFVINDTLDASLYFMEIDDTGKQNLFSYFLKVGIIKPTKKQNTLGCNLVLHYCPQLFGEGWYKFYNLNYESYGNIEQNINYIGIEFIYGLSLTKSIKIEKYK